MTDISQSKKLAEWFSDNYAYGWDWCICNNFPFISGKAISRAVYSIPKGSAREKRLRYNIWKYHLDQKRLPPYYWLVKALACAIEAGLTAQVMDDLKQYRKLNLLGEFDPKFRKEHGLSD